MENKKLKGTVLGKFTKKRYPATSVRFQSLAKGDITEVEIEHCTTDDNGNFIFDLSDKTRWHPGPYVLSAFHPDAQLEQSVSVSLDDNKGVQPGYVKLDMVPNDEISQTAGRVFLIAMVITLGLLILVYYHLHDKYPAKHVVAADGLNVLVNLGYKQLNPVNKINKQDDSSMNALKQTITDLNTLVDSKLAKNPPEVTTAHAEAVKTLLDRATQDIDNKDISSLAFIFGEIKQTLYGDSTAYFWQDKPKRYLEILFWALGATLVRLTLSAGNYLRKKCFHKHAIGHHVSLIFTVPILAVLITFVISLVKLDIALGDATVALNLDDVRISILIASLIGLAPWGAQEFLGDLADRFFEKLRGLVRTSD